MTFYAARSHALPGDLTFGDQVSKFYQSMWYIQFWAVVRKLTVLHVTVLKLSWKMSEKICPFQWSFKPITPSSLSSSQCLLGNYAFMKMAKMMAKICIPNIKSNWNTNMKNEITEDWCESTAFLTRARPGGGRLSGPLRFFADSKKRRRVAPPNLP